MKDELYLWIGFGAIVAVMLVLDLGVFHRSARAVRLREAAAWTILWVSVAMVFCGVVYAYDRYYQEIDEPRWLDFLTGYVIEWSLSMDNVFVFAVIFTYFAVPAHLQHRVLFWGILGAVVMRLVFIWLGVELLERYHWLIYAMGAFLILTGLKLLWRREGEADVSRNLVLRVARSCLPVTPQYIEQKFFVRMTPAEARGLARHPERTEGTAPAEAVGTAENNLPPPTAEETAKPSEKVRRRFYATPLFLVLLVVESTDVAFAVDSIPAILAITVDPFIVFSSNVFAILGLRSLYFLLAGTMNLFRYLGTGLAAILCFVGVKMLLPGLQSLLVWAGWLEAPLSEDDKWKIPTLISLGVVCGILVVSVAASLIHAWLAQGRAARSAAGRRDRPTLTASPSTTPARGRSRCWPAACSEFPAMRPTAACPLD